MPTARAASACAGPVELIWGATKGSPTFLDMFVVRGSGMGSLKH